MIEYVHLEPSAMEACDLSEISIGNAEKHWLCRGCGAVRRNHLEPISIQVDRPMPSRYNLWHASPGVLGLVSKELLRRLQSAGLSDYLMIGDVHKDGKINSNFSTYRGKYEVVVRGVSNAGFRRCDQCGNIVYFSSAGRFLFPEPPFEVPLWVSNATMVISLPVFSPDLIAGLRGIRATTIRVADRPLDGFFDLNSGDIYCQNIGSPNLDEQ